MNKHFSRAVAGVQFQKVVGFKVYVHGLQVQSHNVCCPFVENSSQSLSDLTVARDRLSKKPTTLRHCLRISDSLNVKDVSFHFVFLLALFEPNLSFSIFFPQN